MATLRHMIPDPAKPLLRLILRMALPTLRKIKRTSTRLPDLVFLHPSLARKSNYIDGSSGIVDHLGAPLIAWVNYHHREILEQ